MIWNSMILVCIAIKIYLHFKFVLQEQTCFCCCCHHPCVQFLLVWCTSEQAKIYSVNCLHYYNFQLVWYVFLQYQRWPTWCNKVARSRNAVCNVLSLSPLELMHLYMFKSLTECCHMYGFYKKCLWIDYSREHYVFEFIEWCFVRGIMILVQEYFRFRQYSL